MTGEKAKILVVDDHEINRVLLREILSSAGYTVLEADNGGDGLRLLQQENPRVIVTDLVMPSVNGGDFIRRIRLKWPDWQGSIFLHTAAYDEGEAIELCRSFGAKFLPSPVDPGDILRAVNEEIKRQPPLYFPPSNREQEIEAQLAKLRAFIEKNGL